MDNMIVIVVAYIQINGNTGNEHVVNLSAAARRPRLEWPASMARYPKTL